MFDRPLPAGLQTIAAHPDRQNPLGARWFHAEARPRDAGSATSMKPRLEAVVGFGMIEWENCYGVWFGMALHRLVRLSAALVVALLVFLPGASLRAQDASPDEAVGDDSQVLTGGVSSNNASGGGDVFSTGTSDTGDDYPFAPGDGSPGPDIFNGVADDTGDPPGDNPSGNPPPSDGGTPDPGLPDPTQIVPTTKLPCGMNALEAQAWGSGGVAMLSGIIPDCATLFKRPPLQARVSTSRVSCSPLPPEARQRLRDMAEALDDLVGCGAAMSTSLANDLSARSEFIHGFVDPIEGTLRSYAQKPGQPVSQMATAIVNFLGNDDPNKFVPLRDAALKAIQTARTNPQYAAGYVAGNLAMSAGPGAAACPAKFVGNVTRATTNAIKLVKAARRLARAERNDAAFGAAANAAGKVPSTINGRNINAFNEGKRCVPSSIALVKSWATGKKFYADDIQLRFTDSTTSWAEVKLLLWKNFGKRVFNDHTLDRRIDQMFGEPVLSSQSGIAQELTAGGNGSNGIVFMEGLVGADGVPVNHAFVARNVGGNIQFLDAANEFQPGNFLDASSNFSLPHSRVMFYRTH